MTDRHLERLIDYLDHIKIHGEHVGSFIEGMDQAEFMGDSKTQAAVCYQLMCIGEAAARIKRAASGFLNFTPKSIGIKLLGCEILCRTDMIVLTP